MKDLKYLYFRFSGTIRGGIFLIMVLTSPGPGWCQPDLEQKFLDPPQEAKPRGYWIWAHGNFDYSTISRELRAFSDMGLGGVDIFDMGITDPLGIIPPGNPFMGEQMLDGIEFALTEAKSLGLEMGLSVSNGWNAGGEWTTPDEMIMRLLFWQDTLQGPVTLTEIGFPEVPRTFEKPYGQFELFPRFNPDGFPEYYENVALIAFPFKDENEPVDPQNVLYFDPKKIDGNRTRIRLPEGNWIIVRGVVTPLGQKMWMRSDLSNGFIMDHYSKKATKHHFNHIIGKLEERMGDLGETSLERLYLASFEAENYVIWSPELQDEFYSMHGYQIGPYVPTFAGYQVVNKETTDRFLYDYRLTVSEMFISNHYRQASRICRDHGVLLASESGGPGPPLHYVPTEDLKALGSVDIMRGEFWNKHERLTPDGLNLMQVVKNIASAAHIYGHKVVEMESFTSQRYHWQESPFELKPLADRAFCEGMTRVVYHTMPHSPPEAGIPGWSYQAGTHIHPKMTWWPMSKPFHQYLARCSALLMEGRFVADVAYYYGHEIPNFARPKHIRTGLGAGYDYDDLNTEVMLQIEEVIDGKIVLPSGMEYRILVLPDDPRMDLSVVKKIEELLEKGATVIGPKPETVYGLSGFREKEEALKSIADRIWGKGKSKKIDRRYGNGRIISGKTPREILAEMNIPMDFSYSIFPDSARLDFIHRSAGKEDIYFIRNMDSVDIRATVTLRVNGKIPELWDPESGKMHIEGIFAEEEYGISLPLCLPPYGSIFVILRDSANMSQGISTVEYQGKLLFPGEPENNNTFRGTIARDGDLHFTAAQPGVYRLLNQSGKDMILQMSGEKELVRIRGSWDVRFPYGWGVQPIAELDSLTDWTKSLLPGLKYFSGTATYRKTFELDNDIPETESRIILDLGLVREVARVYLNGKPAGISIFPPHRLDVTDLLEPGKNYLEIEVANTWLNRLIGDLQLPLDKQFTRSNVAEGNDPSRRPWSGYPLPSSGLIGPVVLKVRTVITK